MNDLEAMRSHLNSIKYEFDSNYYKELREKKKSKNNKLIKSILKNKPSKDWHWKVKSIRKYNL